MSIQNSTPARLPYPTFMCWLMWFLLGNACLYWLIGLYYVSWVTPFHYDASDTLNAILIWSFILFTWIGHFALLAFLLGIPLLLLFLLRLPQKAICYIASVLAASALFLLISDAIIFGQYRFHLNGVIWDMLVSKANQHLFNFSLQEKSIILLSYCCFCLFEGWLCRFIWRKLPILTAIKYPGYLYGIPSISLFLSYMMFLVSLVQPLSSIAQHPQAFPLYNTLLAKLLPITNSLEILESVGYQQFRQPIKATAQLNYPLKPLHCQPLHKPLNIVFIAIDAWRYDMVTPAVTPHIYRFAQQNWQFKQHYSGGNSTQPGIFSLFYGIPATYWNSFLQQQQGPLLIQTLLKQGYQMGIFASAPLSMPAFDKTVFRDIASLPKDSPGEDAIARDKHITQAFINFLAQAKQTQKPFFSFLFYDAAHSLCTLKQLTGPFQPMLKQCNRLMLSKDTQPTLMLNRYKNALYTVDQQVEQVLSALKKQALLDNTLVIITADHGEEFNDNKNGYWGHASNFTHFQTQVPLLMHWPHKKPQTILYQTSHFDIVPTLLSHLLQSTNPATDYSIGKSLFNATPKDYLLITSYINYGIIENHKITTIYATGNYKIEDRKGNPLNNTRLDMPTLQRAIRDMKYFYRIN